MKLLRSMILMSKLTLEQKIDNALMWIESLDLPKGLAYPQGERVLGNESMGFCCLGLQCHLSGNSYSYHWNYPGYEENYVGLVSACSFPVAGSDLPPLANMNDEGVSFREIASHLKKHPHEYLEEGVADYIKLAYS